MKSLGKCIYCTETVSEMGAYVKISGAKYAHLKCYDEKALEVGKAMLLAEQAAEVADKLELAKTQAVLAYQNARRCEKCGVTMLADRPAALPDSYASRQPSSSDQRQCSECVRAEIGARAGARRTAAPASAAEAIRTAPTRPAEVVKEIPEEDKKILDLARVTGIAIDLD